MSYEGTNKFPVLSPEGVVDKFGERITIWVSPGQRINWRKEVKRQNNATKRNDSKRAIGSRSTR